MRVRTIQYIIVAISVDNMAKSFKVILENGIVLQPNPRYLLVLLAGYVVIERGDDSGLHEESSGWYL